VSSALEAARHYRIFAQEGTRQRVETLKRDITTAFNDILLAKASADVAAQSVRQLEGLAKQAEDKYKGERASEFELLSARVRLANEVPRLIGASNQLAVAKASFRRLVNLEALEFDVAGELAYEPVTTPLATLEDAALTNRFELRQFAAQLALLQDDVEVARGDYRPTLRAVASYNAEDPDSMTFSAGWATHWRAGLTAEWALFDGGLRMATVREKRLNVVKARNELDELRRQILLEIKQAYLDMVSARETAAGSQRTVELAAKALEIAGIRYEQGLSTYLEFTETNLALNTARLDYLSALRNHRNAAARLRYASGIGNGL
jgi:outer membrane protein